MDCNKEEAMRAKSIAESKLEQNDFTGAVKFASRARTLYPGLDGISQMLTTLDVHISAEKKINGLVDWYAVLHLDPTADDDAINKRYKRLALVLHPDKNKSPGADGAFKLIFEAKTVLLDKDKRTAYDLITGRDQKSFQHTTRPVYGYGSFPGRAHTTDLSPYSDPPAKMDDKWTGSDGPSMYTWARPDKWTRTCAPSETSTIPSFTPADVKKQSPMSKKKSAKTGPSCRARAPKQADKFWTFCHQCGMQFEYMRIYCNTILCCPNCTKSFMSTEIPRPIGKSSSHKPKPWPPNERNASGNNIRTPNTNGLGKYVHDARKTEIWEPLFREPYVGANVAYYPKPDGSDGMEGLFKRRKFNDYGGLYGNNYSVPHGDVHFGKADPFLSASFGFAGWCNA